MQSEIAGQNAFASAGGFKAGALECGLWKFADVEEVRTFQVLVTFSMIGIQAGGINRYFNG